MDNEQGFQVGDDHNLPYPHSRAVSGPWQDQELALGQSAHTHQSHSWSPREEGPPTLSWEPSRGTHSSDIHSYIHIFIHVMNKSVSVKYLVQCLARGSCCGSAGLHHSFILSLNHRAGLHNSGGASHMYAGALHIPSRKSGPGPGLSGFTDE